MSIFVHVFILLMTPNAQASEWSDVLRSVDGGKVSQTPVCSSTQIQPEICKNPVAELCKDVGSAAEPGKVLKQLRNSVSQTPSGDLLDQLYQKMMDAQNHADQANQALLASWKASAVGLPPAGKSTLKPIGNPKTVAEVVPSTNTASPAQNQVDHENAVRADTQAQRDLFQAQNAVLEIIAKLEAQILKKFGKNESELKSYLASVRGSLLKQVKEAPEFNFTSDEKEIRPSRDILLQTLNSVEFITSSGLAAQALPKDEKLNSAIAKNKVFFSSCSTDGLAVNAFFSPRVNTLTICPGLIFRYLQQSGTLDSMGAVVGHEFGHSIDSKEIVIPHDSLVQLTKSYPQASLDHHSTYSSYQKFLDCIDHYFVSDPGEHFTRLDDLIKRFSGEGILNVQKELEVQLAINPPNLDKIAGLKRTILEIEDYVTQGKLKLLIANRKNSVIQIQEGELEADYESSVVLRDQLTKLAPEKRIPMITSSLQLFCTTPAQDRMNALIYGDQTEAIHPPQRFRIENQFRNPEIRALLGCSVLAPGDRPWCSLAGPATNVKN